MCELLSILSAREDLLKDLDKRLRDAHIAAPLESMAATTIQRVFRGAYARERITFKNGAAGTLQRVFRGYSARLFCKKKRNNVLEDRRISVFAYFALQVQKSFRGYYSRKYRQNHASRKSYIKNILLAGDEIRRSMQQYAENQSRMADAIHENQKQKDFKYLTQNLHHLVSTKHVRGVYNPRVQVMEIPTINEVPVETFLRAAVKDLLKTKGLEKTPLVRDINGTLKIPLKGMKNRLSLQASAPYDMVEKEKKEAYHLHKILTRDKNGEFFAGGKTKLLESKPIFVSSAQGNTFADSWSNPMLMRGVPESQKQLNTRALSRTSMPTFASPPEKPFVLSSSGNKSVVYSNGIFDTIADAEISGGVTKRHLSNTARYGLPDSADNRLPGSTLPLPPDKTILKKTSTRSIRAQEILSKSLSKKNPMTKIHISNAQKNAVNDPNASSDED